MRHTRQGGFECSLALREKGPAVDETLFCQYSNWFKPTRLKTTYLEGAGGEGAWYFGARGPFPFLLREERRFLTAATARLPTLS